MSDPIDNITWIHWRTVAPNDYNPNWVMPAEMDLLEQSILKMGWIQPIIVSPEGVIIDGFHRWQLTHKSKPMLETYGGKLPAVIMDIPRWQALCVTVRINRAKGMHGAQEMALIVKELVDDLAVPREDLMEELGMTAVEIDALYCDSVFKARNIKAHKYSKAWVPEETRHRKKAKSK